MLCICYDYGIWFEFGSDEGNLTVFGVEGGGGRLRGSATWFSNGAYFRSVFTEGFGSPLIGEERKREKPIGPFILPLPLLDIPRQKGLLFK